MVVAVVAVMAVVVFVVGTCNGLRRDGSFTVELVASRSSAAAVVTAALLDVGSMQLAGCGS